MIARMVELDKQWLVWINSHHHPALDVVLAPVSYVGEGAAGWVVVCLVMLVVGRPGWRKMALSLLVTMLVVDRLASAPLGHFFPRERPYLALEGVRQLGMRWGGNSFPSGHAVSVWIATVMLGSWRPRLRVALVAFALLTCYARPYLGMHYPLDVLVGAGIGAVAGLGAMCVLRRWGGRGRAEEEARG